MSQVEPSEPRPVSEAKQFLTIRIIAFAMLLASPLLYLHIAYLQSQHVATMSPPEILRYIQFFIAFVTPPVAIMIERIQIKAFRSGAAKQTTPAALFQTISIIKMACINSAYIFGFIVVNMTREFTYIYYFYPIGIIWSFFYWPTRGRYELLKEKLEHP